MVCGSKGGDGALNKSHCGCWFDCYLLYHNCRADGNAAVTVGFLGGLHWGREGFVTVLRNLRLVMMMMVVVVVGDGGWIATAD